MGLCPSGEGSSSQLVIGDYILTLILMLLSLVLAFFFFLSNS